MIHTNQRHPFLAALIAASPVIAFIIGYLIGRL